MATIFAVGLGLCASVEGANLLTNGGFNGPVGDPNYTLKERFLDIRPEGWSGGDKLVYLCMPGVPGSGYPSTDTVFNNNGGLATIGTPGSSSDGGTFVISHAVQTYNTAIYQTLTNLTVGQMYSVTFSQAGGQNVNYSGDTWAQWIVGFGSQTKQSDVMITPSEGIHPWEQQTFYFTADSTSETLSFRANGGDVVNRQLIYGSNDAPIAYLDGVSVNAVPEPSSLALSGLGIFSLVGVCFRRRTSFQNR